MKTQPQKQNTKEHTIQRTRRRNGNKMVKSMGGKPKRRPDKTILPKHF
jgi:hypothetical protein